MPVRVTLRTKKDFSPFRALLKKLIELPDGDSILLCSGYIQEISPLEQQLQYSVLADELLTNLIKGCSKGRVITVAGKFQHSSFIDWQQLYQWFIVRLRKANLRVEAWQAPRKNWHAKVAIRLKNDTPIAALIGSSNLTRPAYGIPNNIPKISKFIGWNFEGDVLIWNDTQYFTFR